MSIAMRRGVGAIASTSDIYTANAVNFTDGADYLSKASDLTSNSDSKIVSGSVWIKTTDTAATIFKARTGAGNTGFGLRINAGKVFLTGFGVSSELAATSATSVDTGSWVHILFSFDLSDTGKRQIYINGSLDSTSWTTYDNTDLDLTSGTHGVGADPSAGGDGFEGDMSDLWAEYGVYVDFSLAANRLKFRNAGGKPVNLGSDGSVPTSSSPILYFSRDTTSWHTNKGTGGGFTENGTLTTASTSPSD